MSDVKTTADLRKTLLDAIEAVQKGELDHRSGATIAALSKTVLASAKLDLEVLRHFDEKHDEGSELKAVNLQSTVSPKLCS